MKENKKEILRKIRRTSLLAYLMSAKLVGDIKKFESFDKMWAVIKEDLEEVNKMLLKEIK